MQYINNVVYNWGVTGLVGGHSAADHWLDAINNYFIKGPNSGKHFVGEFAKTDQVYQSGNLVDENRNGKFDPREVIESDFSGPTLTKSPGVVPKIAVTVDPADQAMEKVLAGAGASLHRDAIDTRLVDSVKSFGVKGAIIKEESAVGGHPPLRGGEPHADYPADPEKLEEYLNSLVK